jgi:hypothetical protein
MSVEYFKEDFFSLIESFLLQVGARARSDRAPHAGVARAVMIASNAMASSSALIALLSQNSEIIAIPPSTRQTFAGR